MNEYLISTLDIKTAVKFVKHYEQIAADLKAHIKRTKQQKLLNITFETDNGNYQNAIDIALAYINNGMTTEAAIRAACQQTGEDQIDIKRYVYHILKQQKTRLKTARNAQIKIMSLSGETNKKIAGYFKLSPATVSRILVKI